MNTPSPQPPATLAARAERLETQSRLLARVAQAYLRPAHRVPASTSIVEVARLFKTQRTSSVLVDGMGAQPGVPGLGIFTATSLQDTILDGRPLDVLAVGALATHPVVTIAASASMGDALAVLLRQRVHRLVVLDETGAVQGVLHALDLLGFVANQSHLVGVHIEQAHNLAALALAAQSITPLIAALHQGGMRIGLMAQLVQQLNARLFERAWGMVAPQDLQDNSCLFVMGSEGRGEQLLKTDQDNGLLLRDGYAPPEDLAQICQRFSDVLRDFGYPPCPGGVMLSNPAWRGSVTEFSQRARRWLLLPQADSLMQLAIFIDAQAVAGDATLLAQVRSDLQRVTLDSSVQLARFAAPVLAFDSSPAWWQRLLGRAQHAPVHVKKAGLFPIVHGARSLALAHGIHATSTTERLEALVAQQVLDAELAGALAESLHFFMELRLHAGLQELEQGQPVSNQVELTRLSSLERQLLHDTLAVVQRFKTVLQQRLRLDAV